MNKTEYIIIVEDCFNLFWIQALSETRASSVITSLKSQFARHVIPNIVRSDNGPQFSTSDFKMFSKEWVFEYICQSTKCWFEQKKIEKAVNTAKQIIRELCLTTRIPTSLSLTGGIHQPKASTPHQYREWWEGAPVIILLNLHLQNGGHSIQKENMLKKCSK